VVGGVLLLCGELARGVVWLWLGGFFGFVGLGGGLFLGLGGVGLWGGGGVFGVGLLGGFFWVFFLWVFFFVFCWGGVGCGVGVLGVGFCVLW